MTLYSRFKEITAHQNALDMTLSTLNTTLPNTNNLEIYHPTFTTTQYTNEPPYPPHQQHNDTHQRASSLNNTPTNGRGKHPTSYQSRRKDIPNSDPMIYSHDRLEQEIKQNDLTIFQIHHHVELNTHTYLLHIIYEVPLREIYHHPHYFFSPKYVINVMGLPPWSQQSTSLTSPYSLSNTPDLQLTRLCTHHSSNSVYPCSPYINQFYHSIYPQNGSHKSTPTTSIYYNK